MNIKKLMSGLLAAGTIAFSCPLAFANWTTVMESPKMINFEKNLGKHKWCWLSSSLKLIEYWTTKYKEKSIEKDCQETLERITDKNLRQENFETFFKTFNLILRILKTKYPNDCHGFSCKPYLRCDEDEVCNSIVAIKGVESFLNRCYDIKFHSFEINFANKGLETLDKKLNISSKSIENPNAFDIASKIIDENKCPLLVALPTKRTKNYSVEEIINSLTSTTRKANSSAGAIALHGYLVSGIDSQRGLIRLVNPTPRKSSETVTEISKDEFNEFCFCISGILDKEFNL